MYILYMYVHVHVQCHVYTCTCTCNTYTQGIHIHVQCTHIVYGFMYIHVCRLYLWNIQKLRQEPPLSQSHSPIPPDVHACVSDSWQAPAQPCGLTDMLVGVMSIASVQTPLLV